MATPTTEEKEQVIKDILEKVLRIEVHPFHRRGNEVLREMLINGKGVKETSKILNLPLTRVKQLFPQAIKILDARLDGLNKDLSGVKEMESEIKTLTEKLKRFEEKKERLDALPEKTRKYLSIKIEDIDLPMRVVNTCRMEKILTVGDLVKLSKREFLSMRNIGRQCAGEVEEFLFSKDLRWEMKI
jgi:hypothetical protein